MRIDIRHHNIDIRPHRFPLPIAKNHLKTVPQHHCVLGNDKTIFNFPFQHNLHIHSFYQIPVGITYPRTNLNLSAFIDQGIDLRHIPVKYFFIIDKRNNLHPLFQCNFLYFSFQYTEFDIKIRIVDQSTQLTGETVIHLGVQIGNTPAKGSEQKTTFQTSSGCLQLIQSIRITGSNFHITQNSFRHCSPFLYVIPVPSVYSGNDSRTVETQFAF